MIGWQASKARHATRLLAAIGLAGALLGPTVAEACPTRPERASRAFIPQFSDVIVRGDLTSTWITDGADGWDLMTGHIATASVSKGVREPFYRIRQSFWSFYCRGWGWEPDRETRTHRGRFYLRANGDGSYFILRRERWDD